MEKAFSPLTSSEDVDRQFGKVRGEQLKRIWAHSQPRWLEVTLVKAENLASLDHNGLSDPYCVLTLVPPQKRTGLPKSSSLDSLLDLGQTSLRSISGISIRGISRGSLRTIRDIFRRDATECNANVQKEAQVDPKVTTFRRSSSLGSMRDANAAGADADVEKSRAECKAKWARVRSKMVDAKLITRIMNYMNSFKEAESSDLAGTELESTHGKVATGISGLFVKSATTSVRQLILKGPVGPENQYAKVQSKCIKRTLNPVYNQFFEMHLEGGEIDKNGNYHNRNAPFTKFRLEMWDADLLSTDDFMGEITVPLAPLMSCRTMEGWFDLEDPEDAYQNDDEKPLSGRVYLKFKWNYEALLEGSMRPKRTENDDKGNDNEGNDNDTDFIHVPHLSCASSHSPAKNRSTGKFVGCQSSPAINGEERGGGNASLVRWPMSLSCDNTTSGGEPPNSSPVLGIGSLPGESKKGVSHFVSEASPIPKSKTSPISDRFPLLLPDESGDKGVIPSLHFRSAETLAGNNTSVLTWQQPPPPPPQQQQQQQQLLPALPVDVIPGLAGCVILSIADASVAPENDLTEGKTLPIVCEEGYGIAFPSMTDVAAQSPFTETCIKDQALPPAPSAPLPPVPLSPAPSAPPSAPPPPAPPASICVGAGLSLSTAGSFSGSGGFMSDSTVRSSGSASSSAGSANNWRRR